MGRNNKKYNKTLHEQAYDLLVSMQAFGESKKKAKAEGKTKDKIFSFSTYKTYWRHIKYFLKWVKKNHPECLTLNSAKKYVKVWLQERTDAGLSPWTIHTEAKALGKLYGITPDSPDYFVPPQRKRADIKRSRGRAINDKRFSERNNQALVNFCKGTGLRRSELTALRGSDLFTKEQIAQKLESLNAKKSLTADDQKLLNALRDALLFEHDYYIYVRSGKGGRKRFSPIIGDDVSNIVNKMKSASDEEKLWKYVHSLADIHAYRASYAANMYKMYARPIGDIPFDKFNRGIGVYYQGDVYCCRQDQAGKKLDKKAMLLVSKALGHNRLTVVANNYLWNL